MNQVPAPTALTVHQSTRQFEISFDDGAHFLIPFELMRVFSPSAEVMGHGPGQETLQTGKREVQIVAVEPIGNYAVKPVFSDGHESGIFPWRYLYDLGARADDHWARYLAKLQQAGIDRDAPMVKAAPKGGCG